ncbi:hypothetical protein ABEW34_16995 [Paenibacillus algorifonticola]|uniref:hypothetical protein n=1 Tax=Paenibacillus algorifonticola TaxID=684063 RepID=UPI003D275CA7
MKINGIGKKLVVASVASTMFLSGVTLPNVIKGDFNSAVVEAHGERITILGPDGLSYMVAFVNDQLWLMRDGSTTWIQQITPQRLAGNDYRDAYLVGASFNGNNIVASVRWPGPGLVTYTSTFYNVPSIPDRVVIQAEYLDPARPLAYISIPEIGQISRFEYYYQLGNQGTWNKIEKISVGVNGPVRLGGFTVAENVKINVRVDSIATGQTVANGSYDLTTVQVRNKNLTGPDGKLYKLSILNNKTIEVRNAQNNVIASYSIPNPVIGDLSSYLALDYMQYMNWEGNDLVVTAFVRKVSLQTGSFVTARFSNLTALNP